jgi:hypothetical protein
LKESARFFPAMYGSDDKGIGIRRKDAQITGVLL